MSHSDWNLGSYMSKQILYIRDKLPDFNTLIKNASTKTYTLKNGFVVTKYRKEASLAINYICDEIVEQGLSPVESLYMSITWYEKNKRRDPDNIAVSIKYILDALQKTGIIKNDGWEQVTGWENKFCVDTDYHVEVEITEIGKSKKWMI